MEPKNSVLKIDNLFARRSIRRFTGQPVTEEQIQTLLQAGMAAPSAGNRKPWHFIAITDQGTRDALADAHPHAQMLHEAPLCIVPCGDPGLSFADRPDYWIQDLAAATENILVAALGLGLGSVWCGVYPVQDRVSATRRILEIPDHIMPFAYIVIGHPNESKEPRTQYDPERVHLGHW